MMKEEEYEGKTVEELLEGEVDVKWKENPNRTPGLAEGLNEACKKYHMSVEELRKASAALERSLCRERISALHDLLGNPQWRNRFDEATQSSKEFYAVNFARAFPQPDDAEAIERLHTTVYPLLDDSDLMHVMESSHNSRVVPVLQRMLDDYRAWKASRP